MNNRVERQSHLLPINNPEDILELEIKSLIDDYPDLIKAGGILVRGTPWKGEAANDDTLRVYYSYEQQEINENKLVDLVKQAHEAKPFDLVVTLPSGGVNLGAKIARTIDRPLHYVHASAYDSDGNKGILQFSETEIGAICEGLPKGSRILLADDLSDSGQALEKIKEAFEKRGMVVVTATTYKKEGSSHTPDICPFPDHSGLWIVQPSEFREGPVADHDKAGIKNHPVTRCIEEVVDRVSVLLDKYAGGQNAYKTLQFYVPKDAFDPRVSMAVAKILKDKYRKIDVQFVGTAIDPTVLHMAPEVSGVYGDVTLKSSMIGDSVLGISFEQIDADEDSDKIHSDLINGSRVPVSNLLASGVNVKFRIHYKYYDSGASASNLGEKLMREFPNTTIELIRGLGPATNLSFNSKKRIIVISC